MPDVKSRANSIISAGAVYLAGNMDRQAIIPDGSETDDAYEALAMIWLDFLKTVNGIRSNLEHLTERDRL